MDIKVRYSMLGRNRSMSCFHLLNCFQDCGVAWEEEHGNTLENRMENGKVWLLSAWNVEIERLPKVNETVDAVTFPYKFDRFLGLRNYSMKDEAGDIIAKADSVWFYFDLNRQRPIKPTPEVMARYEVQDKLDMTYMSRKFKLEGETETAEPVPVIKSFIDTNGHVNNACYVEIAENLLPDDFHVSRIRVEYKSQARLGTMLIPVIYRQENYFGVELKDEEGIDYADVLFTDERQ